MKKYTMLLTLIPPYPNPDMNEKRIRIYKTNPMNYCQLQSIWHEKL